MGLVRVQPAAGPRASHSRLPGRISLGCRCKTATKLHEKTLPSHPQRARGSSHECPFPVPLSIFSGTGTEVLFTSKSCQEVPMR